MSFTTSQTICVCAVALFLCAPLQSATISVAAGGNLQTAINQAAAGDTIALTAGAVYSGNFRLPLKTGSGYVTITTAGFTASANRMNPAAAAVLAKVMAPNTMAAFAVDAGAHHFRLIGLDISAPGFYNYGLVDLTSPVSGDSASLAHDFVLDSLYIHGDATAGTKRGVALNSASTTIQNSYISGIKSTFQDAQAICGWDGPGPFVISNNYLEASGENIMFGGSAPTINGLIPSDITIQYNYLYKPLTWQNSGLVVKNLLELKNAQRVTIQYNILENNWPGSQSGYGVVFTVRTCEGGNTPWAAVQDVTYSHNIMRNSTAGIVVSGRDSERTGCPAPAVAGHVQNIHIDNNLLEKMPVSGEGVALLISDAVSQLTYEHNTAFSTYLFAEASGAASPSFVMRNNIMSFGRHGMVGDGTPGQFTTCVTYFPGCVITNNLLLDVPGDELLFYSNANFFASSAGTFVDFAAGNYRLVSDSRFKGKSTDGTDPGVNMSDLAVQTATVASGQAATSTTVVPPVTTTTTTPNTTPTTTTPAPAFSAAFVRIDETTRGNWQLPYGRDGYAIAGGEATAPTYAAPSGMGQFSHSWNAAASDVTALQAVSHPDERVASMWYARGSFTIDTNIKDLAPHQVALYFVDWDSSSRRQTIEVLDSKGNILDTESLSASFEGGVYLVWNVSGAVRFRVRSTVGDTAVASGLFFGSAAASAPLALREQQDEVTPRLRFAVEQAPETKD